MVAAMLVTGFLVALAQSATAQDDLQKRVDQLGRQVDQLEVKQGQPVTEVHRETGGAVLFSSAHSCFMGQEYRSESLELVLPRIVLPCDYGIGVAGKEW